MSTIHEQIRIALEAATTEGLYADNEQWPGNENLQHWVGDHYDGIAAFVRYEDAVLFANASQWLYALLEENDRLRHKQEEHNHANDSDKSRS